MWESIITGVISGVVTSLVIGALYLGLQYLRTEKEAIELTPSPPKELLGPGFRFGVNLARDGDGKIVNHLNWFKPTNEGQLIAEIRHHRHRGFQYKCFVDRKLSESEFHLSAVIVHLEESGFGSPGKGSGKPDRVWFLLPGRDSANDPDGPVNNVFWPE